MKPPNLKTSVSLLVLLVVAVVSFLGGTRWGQPPAGPQAASSQPRKVLYYACPMHPLYHSDRPGDCPSCGMRLEPVYPDAVAKTPQAADGSTLPAGALQVSPERQQAIGIRLGVAAPVSGTRMLRTTGRVAPHENATYPLVAGVEGLIREVRPPTAGTLVRKNEVLAVFYAPQLLGAAQTYLAAVFAQASHEDPSTNANLQRAGDALRNLGVSEGQLDDLRVQRVLDANITIQSPVDGYVLQRNALVGQRVDRGTELYRIADLRHVWVLADVYENQLPFVHPGTACRVTASNRQFAATVSRAQPIFDETTRTLQVRLETDNPGLALKPGMFVDVEFAVQLPPTLAVPSDAIVDTGLRKTLFVDRGHGYFEPRQIETGWRIGDEVEVTKGLMPGERIVISGTFLMDSESRMKSATIGLTKPEKDPVCGMDVDRAVATGAGRTITHQDATYFFCSDECKKKFEAEPAKYVNGGKADPGMAGMPASSPEGMAKPAPAAAVKDVVCGMDVDPTAAAGAGRTGTFRGKTYFFCSDDCKQKFEKEPGKYVK
jgi:membrane fusion protein, copper/silver efflux system